jgi:hypothetical protein
LRRAGLVSVWCGIGSLVAVLVNGFVGMAHKEVCLPQPNHCSGDVTQTVLIGLYVGSLIVLAVRIVAGVIIAATVAWRALAKQHFQP